MAALKQHVDDLAEDVRVFSAAAAQQAVFQEQIVTLREKVAGLAEGLEELKRELRSRDELKAQALEAVKEDLRLRDKEQAAERVSARRWLVGTMLASTTVILMALALIQDVTP